MKNVLNKKTSSLLRLIIGTTDRLFSFEIGADRKVACQIADLNCLCTLSYAVYHDSKDFLLLQSPNQSSSSHDHERNVDGHGEIKAGLERV